MDAPEVKSMPGRYYALYDEIASGGMATVYFGRMLGVAGFARTVAIKRLHPHLAKNLEFASMFMDEARLAARIRHPNVVSTLDVVSADGEMLLVMEYIPGEALGLLVRAAREAGLLVPPRVVVSILVGVLNGLHAAHEATSGEGQSLQIVHRDVSPQNILVGTDGRARVLDFGIAKAAGRIYTTRDGQLKGKIGYMAPEYLTGGKASRVTDVFAASVVLWEALTGRSLYAGGHDGEVIHRILQSPIEPPSKHVRDLPRELDRITLLGLSRDPAQRFPTARDMAHALEECVPPCPPSEVGAFVERMAVTALHARAQVLARIESDDCDQVSTAGGGAAAIPSQVLDASFARCGLQGLGVATVSHFPNTLTMRTCAFAAIDNVMLTYHTAENPSDEEWDKFLAFALDLIERNPDGVTGLVLTEGGGPNSTQRALYNRASVPSRNAGKVHTLVFSDSSVTRGIVTALSWFDDRIRAFKIAAMSEALTSEGFSPTRVREIVHRFAVLKMRVIGKTPVVHTSGLRRGGRPL